MPLGADPGNDPIAQSRNAPLGEPSVVVVVGGLVTVVVGAPVVVVAPAVVVVTAAVVVVGAAVVVVAPLQGSQQLGLFRGASALTAALTVIRG